MGTRTKVATTLAVVAGSSLIVILYSQNQATSDTGAPGSFLDTINLPGFYLPAMITLAILVMVIVIAARKGKAPSTGKGDPTGFRVGKKTTSGT